MVDLKSRRLPLKQETCSRTPHKTRETNKTDHTHARSPKHARVPSARSGFWKASGCILGVILVDFSRSCLIRFPTLGQNGSRSHPKSIKKQSQKITPTINEMKPKWNQNEGKNSWGSTLGSIRKHFANADSIFLPFWGGSGLLLASI